MRISLFLVVVALFATGCGDAFDKARFGKNNHPPFRNKGSDSVCYPTSQSQETCLEKQTSQKVVEQDSNYIYEDPEVDPRFPSSFDPHFYTPPHSFIQLDPSSQEKSMSKHFAIKELMSLRKGKYALYSSKALDLIQTMRSSAASPFIINSAYRSPGYNKGVGGATWSRHMYGDAIDFYSPDVSLDDLKRHCEAHNAHFIQLYKTHIHCDWRFLDRDTDFFDPELDRPLRLSAFQVWAESSIISLDLSLRAFKAHVSHPEPQDGEELLYEWRVTVPDGSELEFESPHIRFEPRGPGLYRIEVVLGGYIFVEKSFRWN